MGNLLFLYFLHPITTRLANKTQRIYSRDELTNPTKNPPPPFVFSLLSVILLHLHYTLQSPSTLFPIPFTPCYYPSFSCYPVSSSPVTIPCSFVTLSPHTLSPLSSSPVTTPVLMLPCPLQLCYYSSVPLLLCLLLPCPFFTFLSHFLIVAFPCYFSSPKAYFRQVLTLFFCSILSLLSITKPFIYVFICTYFHVII